MTILDIFLLQAVIWTTPSIISNKYPQSPGTSISYGDWTENGWRQVSLKKRKIFKLVTTTIKIVGRVLHLHPGKQVARLHQFFWSGYHCHLVMLTLWKNKPNTSRKNERIPFSLHGSRRGLGSYLYLDFQCPPTALNMDMMSWSQPFFNWTHESNKNVLTFPFICHSIATLHYWKGK